MMHRPDFDAWAVVAALGLLAFVVLVQLVKMTP